MNSGLVLEQGPREHHGALRETARRSRSRPSPASPGLSAPQTGRQGLGAALQLQGPWWSRLPPQTGDQGRGHLLGSLPCGEALPSSLAGLPHLAHAPLQPPQPGEEPLGACEGWGRGPSWKVGHAAVPVRRHHTLGAP